MNTTLIKLLIALAISSLASIALASTWDEDIDQAKLKCEQEIKENVLFRSNCDQYEKLKKNRSFEYQAYGLAKSKAYDSYNIDSSTQKYNFENNKPMPIKQYDSQKKQWCETDQYFITTCHPYYQLLTK